MFLLDTNVVSELRRARPHGAVLAWLESIGSAKLLLSVVSIGEIQTGIEITRATNAKRAREIERWADDIVRDFEVAPIDTTIIRLWAKLMVGRPDHMYEDALIAATAIERGLIVVTRDIKDFATFDVHLINPFETG